MTDYVVIRDCYYRQRLYKAGEKVRFPKGVEPPGHFEAQKLQPVKPKPVKTKRANPTHKTQASSKGRGAKSRRAGA